MKLKLTSCIVTVLSIVLLHAYQAKAQTEVEKGAKLSISPSTDGDDSVATTTEKEPKKKRRPGSLYLSWGYNQEWYTKSTVHVKQDALGNDYDMVQVNGNDHKGWNNKSIFRQPVTIPQYNYRIGYYFNKKQDMGIEINFDHTKYIITDNQYVHVKGKLNNRTVDSNVLFAETRGFYYFLNNGANFFLFNFVKRFELYNSRLLYIDMIGKVGVGPVIPHVENRLFDVPNNPHFQFGGWNTGLESALRVTVKHYVFLEISQKVDYARYSNLKVAAGGTAKQDFGTYELILSAGFIVPTRNKRDNPLFTHKNIINRRSSDDD
jgi:hypothetical protein